MKLYVSQLSHFNVSQIKSVLFIDIYVTNLPQGASDKKNSTKGVKNEKRNLRKSESRMDPSHRTDRHATDVVVRSG